MKLSYVEKGSGQPLVLLHGNGEDGSYFKHQIEYFSKNYRAIAVDTRGHGRSPRGTKSFTLKQFARDLKEFLDQRDLHHIILLGFSDGGNIALIFAIMYPQYLDQLVLNGANLNPFGLKITVLSELLIEYAGTILRGYSRVLAGGEAKKAETIQKRELLRLMVREPWIQPRHLRKIHIPTLVIAGTRDMIREDHTRLIHRSIPGSRLRLIRGNHFIAAKRSHDFNRAVEHFLISTERL